jgi:hypothetical protein
MTIPGEYISPVSFYPKEWERIIGERNKGIKFSLRKLFPLPIVSPSNATP